MSEQVRLTKIRIESIDLLKGLVMAIMALDHVRDYFHQSFILLELTDPAHATLGIYLTRWITHFCAPTFSFLAGMSAFMIGRRKSKNELSGFLIRRGIWLVFIELTIITFGWYFDIRFRNFDLQVIWSLGISMICLSLLIYLPKRGILLFSLILICGHNFFDDFQFNGSIWWSILHVHSFHHLSPSITLNVIYPVVPWIGVMSLGYYFGAFYDPSVEPTQRKRLFNVIAVLCLILFIVIRLTNVYGDLLPWKKYDEMSQILFSFFNLTKYPPSFLFLLVTLSGALIFLANSEKWKGSLVNFFSVFGRVPFFYYIIHIYLIRGLALIVAGLTGHGWDLMVQTTFEVDLKNFGFNLGIVYLIWIGITLLLYPLCKSFDTYKQRHKEKWWLSYL